MILQLNARGVGIDPIFLQPDEHIQVRFGQETKRHTGAIVEIGGTIDELLPSIIDESGIDRGSEDREAQLLEWRDEDPIARNRVRVVTDHRQIRPALADLVAQQELLAVVAQIRAHVLLAVARSLGGGSVVERRVSEVDARAVDAHA